MRSGSTRSTSQTFLFFMLPSSLASLNQRRPSLAKNNMNNSDDTPNESNESYYFEEGCAVEHGTPPRTFRVDPFGNNLERIPRNRRRAFSRRPGSPEGRARKQFDISDFHRSTREPRIHVNRLKLLIKEEPCHGCRGPRRP